MIPSVRPILRSKRVSATLRWAKYFFLVTGVLLLSYSGYVLLDAKIFQAWQSWRFQEELKVAKPIAANADLLPAPATLPPEAALPPVEKPGIASALLGRIEVGRVGLAAIVMEGVEEKTLRRAVGHLRETALPGEIGNVVLAGHRDTYFRPLSGIRPGDVITLQTSRGIFHYRVESAAVVTPRDVQVTQAQGGRTLTLITCFPFRYVGPAPDRFIVRAREIVPPVRLPR